MPLYTEIDIQEFAKECAFNPLQFEQYTEVCTKECEFNCFQFAWDYNMNNIPVVAVVLPNAI